MKYPVKPSQDMETKRTDSGGQDSPGLGPVQVVITPTPEEQQENMIVRRRNGKLIY